MAEGGGGGRIGGGHLRGGVRGARRKEKKGHCSTGKDPGDV